MLIKGITIYILITEYQWFNWWELGLNGAVSDLAIKDVLNKIWLRMALVSWGKNVDF